MKFLTLILLLTLSLFAEDKEKTTQGYAQYKSQACDISVDKALKIGIEEDIISRCQCYKQDGNDWLCYTRIKVKK